MARLTALLALAASLVTASPSFAVIKKLVPLKEVLASQQMILVADVEAIHPDKPAVTFKLEANLKGKAPFPSLTVDLTGDTFAKKEKHTRVMLDRLAVGRKLVLFIDPVGEGYAAFGFIEGTWFQIRGAKDGESVRWSFLHCEPYLRRTFKGTTDELRTVVSECLAGKRTPPEPDEKEPPGFGPPSQANPERKRGGGDGYGDRKNPLATARGSPLFAVIPSFVLVGPLAVVAALFPGVFARLAVGMKRWRVFLIVASINSTAAFVYWALREFGWLPDLPAVSSRFFGLLLLCVNAGGLVCAIRRGRRRVGDDPGVGSRRGEALTLLGLIAVVGLTVAGVAYFVGWSEALSLAGTAIVPGQPASGLGREFTAIAVGLIAATLYAGLRPLCRCEWSGISGESMALGAMLAFGAVTLVLAWPRDTGTTLPGGSTHAHPADVRLWFETPDYDEVLSSITVSGDRVYFGVGKTSGLHSSGAVFCLDRQTGREVWRFNDGGTLKPVFATPAVEDGSVFTGEGLHTDVERRLFRLDAATGKPTWPEPVTTTGHTEGSPRVRDGRVYFSAGDDGLYCVSAADGARVWHLSGEEKGLHIDTPPAVADGRVFAGSGYRTLALLGLDARTGTEVWRVPVGLRSFGPPLILGDRVVFGLGTGNLLEDVATESDEGLPPEKSPAGAVVCVQAAIGAVVWRFETPKSVHTALAADGQTVYAACRDGTLYAIDRETGKRRWQRSLGATLTAGPVVLASAVYAVTHDGQIACLNTADGTIQWSRDLRSHTGREVQVLSTPVVQSDGAKYVLLFGAKLTSPNNGAKSAAVFRIEDEAGP